MMSSPVVPRSIAAVLMLLLAVGEAAAQGAKAGAEPKAETPQARCAAANRQSVAELGQAFEAARSRNRLNPVMVSRLLGFEVQLGALRAALPRDGRNLKDCEQLAQNIAAEQERLQRIAGPDPQVVECMAGNQQAHGQALQALAGLPEAVRATSQALQVRLAEIKPGLAREGQTLQDCRQVAVAIAQDRAQILVLTAAAAKPPPDAAAVDACRAGNIDAYGDALRAWRDWASILGVTAGAAEYDAAMLRLRRLRDEVARPGGTLADCEALTGTIAQERARAPRGRGATGVAAGAPASVTAVLAAAQASAPARVPVPRPGAAAASTPAPAAVPASASVAAPVSASAAAPTTAASAARSPAQPVRPPVGPTAAPPVSPAAPASTAAATTAAAAPQGPDLDCRAQHGPAYNDVVKRFSALAQDTSLAEPARVKLQALGERLTALHATLSAAAPGGDCAAIGQALARAAGELQQFPAAGAPAAKPP